MSRRSWATVGLICTTVASLGPGGCGEAGSRKSAQTAGEATAPAAPPPPPAGNAGVDPAVAKGTVDKPRIIYTATIDVIVRELDAARTEVDTLLAAHKGYVAKSEVRNDSGTRRTATYSLRVPVDSFPALVAALTGLGVPERNAVDSQDVSEEYVDVQARIKNLKEQETKLNELLKERRKEEKLEDIIRIGDRIAAVRQDVERAEGRLKYLSAVTTNSTVNLTLREIKDYVPPSAPTFGNRIRSTFGGSWESLVVFLEGVVLFAVGLAPWLPVLIPLGFVGVFAGRRVVRALNTPTPELHRPARARPVAQPPVAADVPPPEPPGA